MRSFLLFILVMTAVGCDGYTSVKGRVVDPSGKPVPEATVKLTEELDNPQVNRSDTATTDEEGRFSVGMTHAPTKKMPFLFEVTKGGFRRHTEKLTGTASYEKEVVLKPEKK
jgi:uncharacterized GH25 family protein